MNKRVRQMPCELRTSGLADSQEHVPIETVPFLYESTSGAPRIRRSGTQWAIHTASRDSPGAAPNLQAGPGCPAMTALGRCSEPGNQASQAIRATERGQREAREVGRHARGHEAEQVARLRVFDVRRFE